MGRRTTTKNWISPAATPPWSSQKQDEELQFLRDRHYFLHGEIIALTAITVFLIFLLFLVFPCVRRAITIPRSASDSTESTKKRNCLLLMRRKRKDDDDQQHPWPPEPFDGKNSGIQQPGNSSSN